MEQGQLQFDHSMWTHFTCSSKAAFGKNRIVNFAVNIKIVKIMYNNGAKKERKEEEEAAKAEQEQHS